MESEEKGAKKTKKSKKEATALILEVLRKHSDEKHTLKRNEIMNLLKKDYNFDYDNKAIGDSLKLLLEYEFCVKAKNEVERGGAADDDDSEMVYSGWYYNHMFEDTELHFLIDGLFFSKYIPYAQCKTIIEKLEKLRSRHFKHSRKLPISRPNENHLLLDAIEAVNEAIELRYKIEFQFNAYGADKKLKPITKEDGSKLIRKVTPYRIAIKNERFYMICAFDNGKSFYHYRLDYMSDIVVLNGGKDKDGETKKTERGRKISDILGYGKELDLDNYLSKRVYMYGGDPVTVKFRAYTSVNRNIVGNIIDWLGDEARFFTDPAKDYVEVSVETNEDSMLYWALQYGSAIEVTWPESLSKKVRKAVQDLWDRYYKKNLEEGGCNEV